MRAKNIDWNDPVFRIQNINIDALNRVCTHICADFRFKTGRIAFHIVSDEELWALNVRHLNHDTLTDVITFPYHTDETVVGEVYISADRAGDNATQNNTSQLDEILRYAIHGVLHLCGLDDASTKERDHMHELEDQYLKTYKSFT